MDGDFGEYKEYGTLYLLNTSVAKRIADGQEVRINNHDFTAGVLSGKLTLTLVEVVSDARDAKAKARAELVSKLSELRASSAEKDLACKALIEEMSVTGNAEKAQELAENIVERGRADREVIAIENQSCFMYQAREVEHVTKVEINPGISQVPSLLREAECTLHEPACAVHHESNGLQDHVQCMWTMLWQPHHEADASLLAQAAISKEAKANVKERTSPFYAPKAGCIKGTLVCSLRNHDKSALDVASNGDHLYILFKEEVSVVTRDSKLEVSTLVPGPKGFIEPCSIAVSKEKVFVADRSADCVWVFDKATGHLCNTVSTWSVEEKSKLLNPTCVAASQDGHFFVIDDRRTRLLIFSPTCQLIKMWREPGYRVLASIAIDQEGGDEDDGDDANGEQGVAEHGELHGELRLFAATTGNSDWVSSVNVKTGQFTKLFRFVGCYRTRIAADGEYIYLASPSNHLVKVYSKSQCMLVLDKFDTGPLKFKPISIACDARSVYVVDAIGSQVHEFI